MTIFIIFLNTPSNHLIPLCILLTVRSSWKVFTIDLKHAYVFRKIFPQLSFLSESFIVSHLACREIKYLILSYTVFLSFFFYFFFYYSFYFLTHYREYVSVTHLERKVSVNRAMELSFAYEWRHLAADTS